ncbi:MAG: acyl carrier protein [Oscillospiraceae bacterium]|nr:acyl carrier protein [Oscillospiraceae bacterium]
MPDIFERMQKIIADQFSVDPEEITMDTAFEGDLGADSVDLVELVMSMEEEFEIGEVQEEELAKLTTVSDCVDFLTNKLDG